MSNVLITIFLGGGIGSVMRSPFLPVGYARRQRGGKLPHRAVLRPLRPLRLLRRDTAFPHHGALRRVHHLLHLQPREPDPAPPGALRRLRALHPCQRGGRHCRGTCRRVGRESPRIDDLVSTKVIPRDRVI